MRSQLQAVVDQIEDALGSSGTDPGEILDTRADSLQDALPLFGANYRKYRWDWSDFQDMASQTCDHDAPGRRGNALATLMALLEPHQPECGVVGDPEVFRPGDGTGVFYYCFLLKMEDGPNLLVRFECVNC